MTPLLRQTLKYWSAANLDPVDAHWFDISDIYAVPDRSAQAYLKEYHPPFYNNIVLYKTDTFECTLMLVGTDPHAGVVFTMWLSKNGQRPDNLPMMVYRVDDKGELQCGPAEGEGESMSDKDMRVALSIIATFYGCLSSRSVAAYRPVEKKGFISTKRKAKGKAPLYDWTTVVIEPVKPKPKTEYKGGTHAPPRHHERRGHMRTLRSGRQVWVRDCKVGNPANGTVFHDYQVRRITQ